MSQLDLFSRNVADVLSEAAREVGVSQSKLALKSGVSQAQISRIFSHKRSVSLEDLFLIAEALGLTAREVIDKAEIAMRASERREAGVASSPSPASAPGGASITVHHGAAAPGATRSRGAVDGEERGGSGRPRFQAISGGSAPSAARERTMSLSEVENVHGQMA